MTSVAAAAYQLMDTDSASLLGTYPSKPDALRAVATAAEKYGRDSEAVLSLTLFRLNASTERLRDRASTSPPPSAPPLHGVERGLGGEVGQRS